MKRYCIQFSYLFCFLTTMISGAQDWAGIAIPAESGNSDIKWELVDELSDSFNYETPSGSNKGTTFNERWEDGFINPWPGFGNTTWSPNNSKVTGGNLELKATSLNGALNTNNFAAIHARSEIIYPVFIETRMKIMNSVMANAVWLLSSNSKEEIDIVEAYGSSYSESKGASRDWFARRMHLSHHTFSSSGEDYQPTDSGSWYVLPVADGQYWRNSFHRVGMYWRDPFHLEYYIDGVLVRTVSGPSVIDPNEHLGGNGLSRPETIIFSGAAQQWQVNGGVWPTVNELAVEANNIFQIDWIRTYKRVNVLSTEDHNISKFLGFNNPIKRGEHITIDSDSDINQVDLYQINGVLVKSVKNISKQQQSLSVDTLSSGMYLIRVQLHSGNWYSGKLVIE
ncbi:T9SS type A sorting domain-containing protein [Algibacter mikhailovii]|nr:T9SS type A sorting domain-containing protein [Algibacter mikhailovii]